MAHRVISLRPKKWRAISSAFPAASAHEERRITAQPQASFPMHWDSRRLIFFGRFAEARVSAWRAASRSLWYVFRRMYFGLAGKTSPKLSDPPSLFVRMFRARRMYLRPPEFKTFTIVNWGLLTFTECRYGGQRPWFLCTAFSGGQCCLRRVAVLYLDSRTNRFACRHCCGLTYASQKEGVRDFLITS
jgi:hypothetical protein